MIAPHRNKAITVVDVVVGETFEEEELEAEEEEETCNVAEAAIRQ